MKVKKNLYRLRMFHAAGTDYLVKNGYYARTEKGTDGKVIKEHYTDKPHTKLSAAIKSVFLKQLPTALGHFDEKMEDVALENAATDKDNIILVQTEANPQLGVPTTYRYTVEGKKKLIEAQRAIVDEEYELDARIVDEWQKYNLLDEERIAFAGIVIPADADDDKYIKHEATT